MPTSKFVLRGLNPEKRTPIVLYFRYGNHILKHSTGFKVLQSTWNEKKQTVRNVLSIGNPETINNGLELVKQRVENAYNELIKEGYNGHINNALLRSKIAENSSKKIKATPYIVDYLKEFLDTAGSRLVKKNNGETGFIQRSTINQYKSTLNSLKQFETFKKTKIKFKDLSLKFHKDYLEFLFGEKNYGKSTVGTRIKTIKTLAKYAKIDEIEVNEAVFSRGFFKPHQKSLDTYLNSGEVQKLFEIDLSHNKRLNRVRDLFIVGVWTGLRISDFSKIKKENLNDGLIEIDEIQKTGAAIVLPIHPQVEQIIEKNNGNFPKPISHQKFNDYIKELCKLVGIDKMTEGTKTMKTEHGPRKVNGTFPKYELISSHTCRRSFCTNNYGVFSNAQLMAISGHKSETVFLNYIKVTPKEHAENMRDKWLAEDIEHKINISLKKVI